MLTDDPSNRPSKPNGAPATAPTSVPTTGTDESRASVPEGRTTQAAETQSESTLNDFADCRLDPEPADLETVRLAQAEARRPRPDEFIRVHATAAMFVAMLEISRLRMEVIVAPSAQGTVLMKLKRRRLHLCINHHDEIFIWAVGVSTGGSPNPWLTSAARAAELGTRDWVRIVAGSSHYEIDRPVANHTLPADVKWPETPFRELVEVAYAGRIIRSADHPLLDELRGRIK